MCEQKLQNILQATRSGGMLVLVGRGPPDILIPIVNASVREIDIRGIFRYANWLVMCLYLVLSLVCTQLSNSPGAGGEWQGEREADDNTSIHARTNRRRV
jgi:hypothetical protein